MTYLTIVNQILRRLREDEVATVTASAYSTLIGDLVNTTKREVEQAWRWKHLREETTFLTGQDTTNAFALTGWGKQAIIRDLYDITNNLRLTTMSDERWRVMVDLGGTVTSDQPWNWRVGGYDSSGDLEIELYPLPPVFSLNTIKAYGWVPQADLSSDTDELLVPDYPVILGAYSRAVSERGEDMGAAYDETVRDYQSALNDAIARDSANENFGYASDWEVI